MGNNVYRTVNPDSRAAILQRSASLSDSGRGNFAGTIDSQVLFTLGIFVTLFPISMLLVVGGAVCAGGLAAACFTRARRKVQHVHRIQVVIEPDTKPELLQKIH
ncbi:MAG TPA: hypothetical protein VLN58_12895 [Verrucomicrobiae bacterium]|nr:hypothetical protein [Verrucomicrobiae bacterium]